MDDQMVLVFGDICSRKEEPCRIALVENPSGIDSGYNVGSGHQLETKWKWIRKDDFLQSHPELAIVMTKMKVGDVATREDTTCGVYWVIKGKKGKDEVVLHTIRVETETSGI